jgi:putative flippase GtrA
MPEDKCAAAVSGPPSGLAQTSQFARFVVVGGFAAGVNVAARWLLDLALGYSAAIILAYLCGMVTAFVLSKRFVFAQSPLGTRTEFIRFGLVNLAAVAQVWAVSIALGDWLLPQIGVSHYAHDIAHVVGVAVPVFTSYWGHKHFSFADR